MRFLIYIFLCISHTVIIGYAGELDYTFGKSGFVITDLGCNTGGVNCYHPSMHAVIQPDQKILAVADIHLNEKNFDVEILNSSFLIIRYNPDGTLDHSFGDHGIVIVPISTTDDPDDFAFDIVLQPDGKIVIVGQTWQRGGNYSDGVLVRLQHNGSLDETFGNKGIVVDNYHDNIVSGYFRALLQKDGNILVVGSQGKGAPYKDDDEVAARTESIKTSFRHCLLARYTANGLPDMAFGDEGKVTAHLFDHEISLIDGLCMQSNGNIVIAGIMDINKNSWGDTSAHTGVVRRYSHEGVVDLSFGDKGVVLIENMAILDIACHKDDSMIIAGFGYDPEEHVHYWKVMRLFADGELDQHFNENFNKNGRIQGPLLACAAKNIALTPEGEIFITGYAQRDGKNVFMLICYNADGTINRAWQDGMKRVPVEDLLSPAQSIALALQDNTVLVAGEYYNGSYYNVALARYHR
jgi:uncharacterized delta-60 repeat protein